MSLGFVALLTVVNLRGVRESGVLFALPTYGFIAVMYTLIGTGVAKCALGECPVASAPDPLPVGIGAVGVFVVLQAFASGAAALTGVEAISNGVNAFRRPQAKNAAATLAVMGVIAITLFVGVSYLAVAVDARPSGSVSVVSELARAVFPGSSPASTLYYAVQGLTLAILVLAANTSYQGFPRLAAVLARDRFFPRQFVNLGDRLVLSNGILILAGLAASLIWIFHADVNALIHLYVVGVFTAFTLSQAGMVRRWRRLRPDGWRRAAFINALGATATGLVTLLVIQAKFAQGAWLVTVTIPLLVAAFLAVNRHYRVVTRRLRAGAGAVRAAPAPTNTVVVYVEALNDATREAARYARRIAGTSYHAIHVRDSGRVDPRGRWWEFSGGGVRIETLYGDEGRVDAVLDYVWSLPRGESTFVTVVIPELFRRPSLAEALLRRRATFSLKLRLLTEPGIVVTDVPVLEGAQPLEQKRILGRVLVSGIHAASLRAINYAGALGLDDTRGVFFAFDADEARTMKREWEREDLGVALDVVEAPYRDIGDPLRRYLRGLTADEDTAVSVVMPELIVPGWEKVLHNQRAVYIKRLLLFERNVLLTSVPYHLP